MDSKTRKKLEEQNKKLEQEDQSQQVGDQTTQEAPSVPLEVTNALATLQAQLKQSQQLNESLSSELKELKGEKKKAVDDKLENDSDLRKVLAELEEGEPEKREKKRNLDQLSNTELVEVIAQAVQTHTEALGTKQDSATKSALEKVTKELQETQQALGTFIARQRIDALNARFPDFEEYKEQIAKEMQETPGLTIEKAYKLAKASELEKHPAPQNVETEIPDFPTGPSGLPLVDRRKKTRKEGEPTSPHDRGVAGFRSLLADGIERALSRPER